MNTNRGCGCKGWNTCLICEKEHDLPANPTKSKIEKASNESYVYCPLCEKAYPGYDFNLYKLHPNHNGTPIDYPGIYIQLDFLTETEESNLIHGMDYMLSWDSSQSGRRKQNYGPKCNFRRHVLQPGNFNGFPAFTKAVQDRFRDVDILNNFQTVEQCSLEYDPIRGAAIDPHIDDCWIWGERIVTLNLLSDTALTMNRYDQVNPQKYNLQCKEQYEPVQIPETYRENEKYFARDFKPIVRIPMPRRSLLVIYGQARYDWEHCVLREDIHERRLAIAYREFTPPYLAGGMFENDGGIVVDRAKNFHEINEV